MSSRFQETFGTGDSRGISSKPPISHVASVHLNLVRESIGTEWVEYMPTLISRLSGLFTDCTTREQVRSWCEESAREGRPVRPRDGETIWLFADQIDKLIQLERTESDVGSKAEALASDSEGKDKSEVIRQLIEVRNGLYGPGPEGTNESRQFISAYESTTGSVGMTPVFMPRSIA